MLGEDILRAVNMRLEGLHMGQRARLVEVMAPPCPSEIQMRQRHNGSDTVIIGALGQNRLERLNPGQQAILPSIARPIFGSGIWDGDIQMPFCAGRYGQFRNRPCPAPYHRHTREEPGQGLGEFHLAVPDCLTTRTECC